MEKYFSKVLPSPPLLVENEEGSKQDDVKEILTNLPTDPDLRPRILDYHSNIRDQVRRAYLLKGPCQPRSHNFPFKKYEKTPQQRFIPSWFDKHKTWLEYSIERNAAYCLCCYLFRPEIGEQGSGDSFVGDGFSNWRKPERLFKHEGSTNSAHDQARRNCDGLLNEKQHIQSIFSNYSTQARRDYRIRLNASIDCVRFLLRQGLAFHGNNEYEESSNRGNFFELYHFLVSHNEDIKNVALENAPENHSLTAPKIQKDIVNIFAVETTNTIIREMDDALFSVLIDESRDVSIKEQMIVVFCYVDKNRNVVERFIGIEHVASTIAMSLKQTLDKLFSRHGLSMFRLRGQGYDGASNMQGEYNGLKSLILKENECAYYIHCFAHQLQLALVGLAKIHIDVQYLFNIIASLVNVVGASAKRRDILRDKQAMLVIEALRNSEISSGQSLNQETSLRRFGDTRWGSHYGTLISIVTMFSYIGDVLEIITEDGSNSEQRCEANNLLELMNSFTFVFCLHLMRDVLRITNELSQALQRKDQDIVNAMKLVELCQRRLKMMRESGWDLLLDQVSSFCVKHNIEVPKMSDMFLNRGRKRRKAQEITNLHHYRVELFCTILDMQLQELNNRFSETSTELFLCLSCLSPNESFSAFDKQKLVRLAQFYPRDFSARDLMALEIQLDTYIMDMRDSEEFSRLKGISELAKRMVETKKSELYSLVFLLVTLSLILPVATAIVERSFSAMNIVKNRLRNRMGDQ